MGARFRDRPDPPRDLAPEAPDRNGARGRALGASDGHASCGHRGTTLQDLPMDRHPRALAIALVLLAGCAETPTASSERDTLKVPGLPAPPEPADTLYTLVDLGPGTSAPACSASSIAGSGSTV